MRAAWWWIDRWRKSTAYTDMPLEAQGAYRNLLDELWLRDGLLPNDERILAKISGDALRWPDVRDAVLARFEATPQGLRNRTHDEIQAESQKRAARQKRYRDRQRGRRDTGNETRNVTPNVPASPSPSPSPSNAPPTPPVRPPAAPPAAGGTPPLDDGCSTGNIVQAAQFVRRRPAAARVDVVPVDVTSDVTSDGATLEHGRVYVTALVAMTGRTAAEVVAEASRRAWRGSDEQRAPTTSLERISNPAWRDQVVVELGMWVDAAKATSGTEAAWLARPAPREPVEAGPVRSRAGQSMDRAKARLKAELDGDDGHGIGVPRVGAGAGIWPALGTGGR